MARPHDSRHDTPRLGRRPADQCGVEEHRLSVDVYGEFGSLATRRPQHERMGEPARALEHLTRSDYWTPENLRPTSTPGRRTVDQIPRRHGYYKNSYVKHPQHHARLHPCPGHGWGAWWKKTRFYVTMNTRGVTASSRTRAASRGGSRSISSARMSSSNLKNSKTRP